MPEYLTENCKDMIDKILIPDPGRRFNIEDIRKHPWHNLY